ncbi:unnamed protein product [Rhodiola kirilowii]
MASASLIAANPVNWKRMSSFLRRPISHATCKSQLVFIRKPENTRPSSFTLKCAFSKQLPNNTASSNGLQVPVSRNRILDAILKATEVLRQPAVVAVFMGALLMYDPHSALAASGDRRRISSRSSLSSSRRHEHSSDGDEVLGGIAAELDGILPNIGLFLICWIFISVVLLANKRSVIKLQVVLSGTSRSSLQRELNCIAEVAANKSAHEGLRYVLTATTSFLLQHHDHWISGYSYVDVKSRYIHNLQNRLKRHKLNVENNIKRQTQSFSAERCSELSDEYVLVTILVAARGVHKLPSINRNEDPKEALQKLASIPPGLEGFEAVPGARSCNGHGRSAVRSPPSAGRSASRSDARPPSSDARSAGVFVAVESGRC